MATLQSPIYTIGHSNRDIDAFVSLLASIGVRTLVDVRAHPTSRRYPHFDSDNLRPVLADADIIYHWAGRHLGGFRQNKPDSRHLSLTGSLHAYADHMARIVLTCREALMPRTQDAEERPHNPLHFLHCTWTCRCREAQDVRERPSMEVRHPNSKGRPIN